MNLEQDEPNKQNQRFHRGTGERDCNIEYDESGFVKAYLCPGCNCKLELDHEDDIGTKFLHCPNCGRQTSLGKTDERKRLEEAVVKPEQSGGEDEGETPTPRGDESQATRIVQLCTDQEITLFHDQHRLPYARIVQECGTVIMPINSRHFKCWLARLFWESEEKASNSDALNSAAIILSARAIYEGEQFTLYNRVAPSLTGEEIHIDLCDERGRAIRVTARGWEIVENPPILFKRFSHQQPLPIPERNGDPWKILEFLNINQDDDSTKLILLCVAISYLVPQIPHPILVAYGVQGSGKTLLFVVLRNVIDPSAVGVLTIPKDERELIQQLDHHWFSVYDNVSSLSEWTSNILCRAVTGGGFTKRELYTDDSDITYNFKRCIG
jgi:hypothetical protein